MNEFDVEIPNWGKFQTRKELKSMTWFRVEGTIFFDSKLSDLGVNSKLFWFWLMSEACRSNAGRVRFTCQYAAKISGIRANFVRIAVDDLERKQLVVVHSRDEFVSYKTEQNKTNRTEQNSSNGGLTKHEFDANLVSSTSQTAKKTKPKTETKTSETWEAFTNAYRKRYGSDPVRNATTNSQMSNFVRRIGIEESPQVAAYYLTLEDQWYTRQTHAVGFLLKDAEKIRTMWATGLRSTNVDAKTAHWRDQARRIEAGEL